MIKERESFFIFLIKFADLALISFVFYFTFDIQKYFLPFIKIKTINPFSDFSWVIIIFLIVWHISLRINKVYSSFRTKKIVNQLWSVLKSGIFTVLILSSMGFLFEISSSSHDFVIIFSLISTLTICIEKLLLMFFFRFIRSKGYNYKQLLVIGTGKRAQEFIGNIRNNPEWGFKIIGILDKGKVGHEVCGVKIIGTLDNILQIITDNIVDEVVVIVPRSWINELDVVVYACETMGVKVTLSVDLFDLKIGKFVTAELNGIPLLSLQTVNMRHWHLLVKRTADIVISAICLAIFSPVFLLISILIKLTSSGPIFFRQIRSGLNGRLFSLYKFRTMVINAEEIQKDILEFNEMDGPVFKIKNDPRVTSLGKILRITSLDELPQFINVLLGDMSLVGPRPPIPSEVKLYEHWQRRRLSMKPGITCTWQVSGRNKISFRDWMKLDLEYIDNWSLGMDLKILLKTIPAVLFGIGAR